MTGLIDRFGRVHRSLRISVTDRCNIRCQYCMPAGTIRFLPRSELLTYEEIASLTQILSGLGIRRLRLTGGEPLVRAELHRLVELLKANQEIESIALTTNGMLLDQHIAALQQAGLDQINVSLDTLREPVFRALSRRQGLDRVLAGIQAAIDHGYRPRLNAVLMRDINLDDAIPLVEFALERGLVIRFIEFMPLDTDQRWDGSQMVSGDELRKALTERFGEMEPIPRTDPSRPSSDYRWAGYEGGVGFIDSVTAPFCGDCDRLRLTAEGKLRNCLFGLEEWDLGGLLRQQTSQNEIREAIHDCVRHKFPAHGIGQAEFVRPQRSMYQIGG